jgi:hypothetical protein
MMSPPNNLLTLNRHFALTKSFCFLLRVSKCSVRGILASSKREKSQKPWFINNPDTPHATTDKREKSPQKHENEHSENS